MSIIITGLEMPTERENFNLTIKYNGTVLDTDTGIQVAEAYELPPHGRCIDADALEDNNITYYAIPVLKNVTDAAIREAELVIRLKDIDNAPTIIPAETTLEKEIKIIDTKGKPNYDQKHRFVISEEENNNDR